MMTACSVPLPSSTVETTPVPPSQSLGAFINFCGCFYIDVGVFILLWVFSITVGVLYITVGIFVFVKLDLSIRSGNSGMGIFVFVKLDLRIRSGNSCMGNFVL